MLKIDQSFVRDLAADDRKLALVETMIALAHRFDYRVVAEGVETERAQALLARAGCDEVQGYLFARPLDPGAFEQWHDAQSGPLRQAA